jgi:HK97 family phage major capsid protein
MANAIPLLSGTNASGGFLVPDEIVQGAFQRGIDRQSAVAALAQVRRVGGKTVKFTEYVGRPAAAFVAEAAAKAATGAEYAQVTVDVKKIAAIVMYTEELLADAQDDPTVLINQDVRAAFADLIDSHALGRNAAGTIVSQFNSELSETTQTVELGTAGDALAVAISSAMGTIEANGYTPNGIILANDGRTHLRNARGPGDNAATPLYTMGFNREPDSLYGVPVQYTTNLQTFAGAAAAGRVVGIVGDFSHALLAVRNDIQLSFSDQATIDVAGTEHRLWQENKVAARWEARVGFVAHDLSRAFVAITNAV